MRVAGLYPKDLFIADMNEVSDINEVCSVYRKARKLTTVGLKLRKYCESITFLKTFLRAEPRTDLSSNDIAKRSRPLVLASVQSN